MVGGEGVGEDADALNVPGAEGGGEDEVNFFGGLGGGKGEAVVEGFVGFVGEGAEEGEGA